MTEVNPVIQPLCRSFKRIVVHFIIKGSPLKISDKMWTPDRSDASFTGRVGSKPKPIFFSVNKNASQLLPCGQGSLAVLNTCSNSASHPQKFDELLQLASKGQHTNVDMLVKDVYGGACQTLGLSGNLIASSFGKSTTADKGISIEIPTEDLHANNTLYCLSDWICYLYKLPPDI